MSSLPSRFRDNLGEVRVSPDQDLGYLPKLLTGSIRPSHEQSCSRRSKAGPGADVAIAADRALQKATALRLKGRTLDSADNVTLGGSTVAADGGWKPADVETPNVVGSVCTIPVPAASAVVVKWTA